MDRRIKAVVLAAGKGTRLRSGDDDVPKVLRTACGKPLLRHVLEALSFIDKSDVIIVVGYKKETVISRFEGYAFAVQEEQLGTGHAVMSAGQELSGYAGSVLICCGDMPAVRRETYEALIKGHFMQGNDCTILTGTSEGALSYGRIIRDQNGGFQQIVEERDCTPDQLKITELNSGVYVFRAPLLLAALESLGRDNSQGEYYLTDVPAIMMADGANVGLIKRSLGDEIIGVNTIDQLRQAESILSLGQR